MFSSCRWRYLSVQINVLALCGYSTRLLLSHTMVSPRFNQHQSVYHWPNSLIGGTPLHAVWDTYLEQLGPYNSRLDPQKIQALLIWWMYRTKATDLFLHPRQLFARHSELYQRWITRHSTTPTPVCSSTAAMALSGAATCPQWSRIAALRRPPWMSGTFSSHAWSRSLSCACSHSLLSSASSSSAATCSSSPREWLTF